MHAYDYILVLSRNKLHMQAVLSKETVRGQQEDSDLSIVLALWLCL